MSRLPSWADSCCNLQAYQSISNNSVQLKLLLYIHSISGIVDLLAKLSSRTARDLKRLVAPEAEHIDCLLSYLEVRP